MRWAIIIIWVAILFLGLAAYFYGSELSGKAVYQAGRVSVSGEDPGISCDGYGKIKDLGFSDEEFIKAIDSDLSTGYDFKMDEMKKLGSKVYFRETKCLREISFLLSGFTKPVKVSIEVHGNFGIRTILDNFVVNEPGKVIRTSFNPVYSSGIDIEVKSEDNQARLNEINLIGAKLLCLDTDAGRDFYNRGKVILGTQIKEDSCDMDGTTLTEWRCTNNASRSDTVKCPGGCLDGKCLEQCVQYAEFEGKTIEKWGVNSVLAESVYDKITELPDDEKGNPVKNTEYKKIASDQCINERYLREYLCEDYWRGGDNIGNYLSSYSIDCPAGCRNGGCALLKNKFCSEGVCTDLTPESTCRKQFGGEFNKGAIGVINGDKETLFEDRCIDSGTKREYLCQGAIKEYNDLYSVPESREIRCREGFECHKDKCIQIQEDYINAKGDLDGNNQINNADIQKLNEILDKENEEYIEIADVDEDKRVDSYDMFRLGRIVNGEKRDIRYSIRKFNLNAPEVLSMAYTDDLIGTLEENLANGKTTWKVEYKKKGASRSVCNPPVLKINLKDVKKKERILGLTNYNGMSLLRYDEFRLVPDCEIWGYETDNLIREYFIHWLYRRYGMPTVDVIGFGEMSFTNPDMSINGKKYNYILLQRDNSDKDEIPFMNQQGISRIIEASDFSNYDPSSLFSEGYKEGKSRIHMSPKGNEINGVKVPDEEMDFDERNIALYYLLNEFTGLKDRAEFHNEDYGYDSVTGKWKYIPFDFDMSFVCYPGNSFFDIFSENEIENRQKSEELFREYYILAKEIFDNPENLNEMLLTLDRFPFRTNRIMLKNEVKNRFYASALYYSSPAFAERAGVPHVPFRNHELYLKEAEKIVKKSRFDSICGIYNLNEILNAYKLNEDGKSSNGESPGEANPFPNPIPIEPNPVVVPKPAEIEKIRCRENQIIGDLNHDEKLNIDDLNLIIKILDNNAVVDGLCCADINKNMKIDKSDIISLRELIENVPENPERCPIEGK